jgi:hypothetical protein
MFEIEKINKNKLTLHSGGADGADTIFENKCNEYNISVKAYSYKTPKHKSDNKVELTEADYLEGIIEIKKANSILNRSGIDKYMNLLARNWAQVKYSDEIFAIGKILNPEEVGSRGYKNKSNIQVVDGGTGYAVMMGVIHRKPVYVFDQYINMWFRWSYTLNKFVETNNKKINFNNFTGIGSRQINENGIKAIEKLIINTINE